MENLHNMIDGIESALSAGDINEGLYLQLMNIAKRIYEKEKEIEELESTVVREYEEQEEDGYVIEQFNRYHLIKNQDKEEWVIGELDDDNELDAAVFFDNIDSAKSYWNINIISQPSN